MMSNAVCLGGNTKGYGFASMVSIVGIELVLSIVLEKRQHMASLNYGDG